MRNRIIVSTTIAILLLVISVGAALFATGKVVFVNRDSDGTVISTGPNICGADIVNRYNDAMYYGPRGESNDLALDDQGIQKLIADIKAKQNYETDPTCQALLFTMAVYNKDLNAARQSFEAVKTLHAKHLYPDNNIRSAVALFEYESLIDSISPPEVLQDDRE